MIVKRWSLEEVLNSFHRFNLVWMPCTYFSKKFKQGAYSLASGGKTWQKSQTVAYIKTLKGTDLQSQQKKRCRTERKMLKIAKKADLSAKRELRFTAGSQGHAEYPTQKNQLQLIDAPMHRHTHENTLKQKRSFWDRSPHMCPSFILCFHPSR